MKPQVTLSIPQPCHENWAAMTPEEKGRFCLSCQKKVYDFTTSSDRQILETIQTQGKVCGRFLPSQLERPLIQPATVKRGYFASLLLGFLGLLPFNNAFSQQKNPVVAEQTVIKGDTVLVEPGIRISGKVMHNGTPVPGVKIQASGTNTSVISDEKGNFSIICNSDTVLTFSLSGMQTVFYRIKPDEKEISVNMNSTKPDLPYVLGKMSIR